MQGWRPVTHQVATHSDETRPHPVRPDKDGALARGHQSRCQLPGLLVSAGNGIEQLLAGLLDGGQDRAAQHRVLRYGSGDDLRVAQADPADHGRDALGERHAAREAYVASEHNELRVEHGADGRQPEGDPSGQLVRGSR